MATVKCKRCNATGWIAATPLRKRNYQVATCGNCKKVIRILTLKSGKTFQF